MAHRELPSPYSSPRPRPTLSASWPLCFCFIAASLLTLTALGQDRDKRNAPNAFSDDPSSQDTDLFSPRLAHQSADATLNDVVALSPARAWAVGDRGAILATQDGGKHWLPQKSNVTCPLYAIAMQNDQQGTIVGGTIHPFSNRSIGVVLNTHDGGKLWKPQSNNSLPRLTGLQDLGQGHLIAWGDYSPDLQSAIFEYTPATQSWNPILLNLGHIQSTAWLHRYAAVIIDRAQRAFFYDGQLLKPLSIPFASLQNITFAKVTPHGIWLGGRQGTLLHSLDGQEWKSIQVPLPPAERDLIEWSDLTTHQDQIVLCTKWGRTLWIGSLQNQSWSTKVLPQLVGLEAIHQVEGDRLVAVGPMSRIIGSRNGGQAWWNELLLGDRLGLLAISHDSEHLPWEQLIAASWQHLRLAGAYVVHPNQVESVADAFPNRDARLAVARSQLALATLESDSQFAAPFVDQVRSQQRFQYRPSTSPLNDSTSTQRKADHPIVRKMVYRIRTMKPDVVFVGRRTPSANLEEDCSSAALLACHLAADKDYHLFLDSSSVHDEPWEIPKVYVSTDGASIDLSKARDPFLPNCGLSIQDILAPAAPLWQDPPSQLNPILTPRGYILQQNRDFSTNTRRELFGGLTTDPHTLRGKIPRNVANYQNITRIIDWQSQLQSLLKAPGTRWDVDPSWESRLDDLLNQSPESQLLRTNTLYQSALQCRRDRYWNRYRAILYRIIRDAPQSDVAEASLLALLTLSRSQEFQFWTSQERRLDAEQSYKQTEHASVAVTANVPVSPFPKSIPTSPDVQQASFVTPTPNSNQPSPKTITRPSANEPELLGEADVSASRLLPYLLVEPGFENWLANHFQESNPHFLRDIRLLIPQAIHSNAHRSTSPNPPPSDSILQTLASQKSIAGWHQLASQESRVTHLTQLPNATLVHFAPSRPWLDGDLTDPLWQSIPTSLAIDPWNRSQTSPMTWQVAYDQQFLYFAIQCPLQNQRTSSTPDTNSSPRPKVRKHDSLDPALDHVRLRLDLDRDYASWFQLGIDRQGQLFDACCDATSWNPDWFVASKETPNAWIIELAIPFSSLDWDPPQPYSAWAFSLFRSIPNDCLQHNQSLCTDAEVPQGLKLLQFLPNE